MGIRFACSDCNKVLDVKPELSGKRGLCPRCKVKVRIPAESTLTDEEYRERRKEEKRRKAKAIAKQKALDEKAAQTRLQGLPSHVTAESLNQPRQRKNTFADSAASKSDSVNRVTHGPDLELPVEFVEVEADLPGSSDDGQLSVTGEQEATPNSGSDVEMPDNFAAAPVMIEPFEVEEEEPSADVFDEPSLAFENPTDEQPIPAPQTPARPAPSAAQLQPTTAEAAEARAAQIRAARAKTAQTQPSGQAQPGQAQPGQALPGQASTAHTLSADATPSVPGMTAGNAPNPASAPSQSPAVNQSVVASNAATTTSESALHGSDSGIVTDANGSNLLDDEKLWYVRPPSGGQFGPASSSLLRKWMREGRVGSRAYVWQDGWPDWRVAGEVLPEYTSASGSGVDLETAQPNLAPQEFSESAAVRARINRKKRNQATLWVGGMVMGMLVLIGLIVLAIILLS